MIQDIQPLKLDNTYSADIQPDENSIVFHFDGNTVLSKDDKENPFPVYADLTLPDNLTYLFAIGNKRYFLLNDSVIAVPNGFSYTDIVHFRHDKTEKRINQFALSIACHLSVWYSSSRYCGKCGGITVPDRKERALKCTFCGKKIYPRINPAVIVGVTDGNRLLITRYAENRGVAHDALIAGFTEIGETLEETVKREVMEEVGLKVKNIRYYKSQPWGASQTILAGFYCDVDENSDITLDETELSCAEWIERENIQGQPDDLSLTNEMMMQFKNGNCQ